MKKLLLVTLALFIAFLVSACGAKDEATTMKNAVKKIANKSIAKIVGSGFERQAIYRVFEIAKDNDEDVPFNFVMSTVRQSCIHNQLWDTVPKGKYEDVAYAAFSAYSPASGDTISSDVMYYLGNVSPAVIRPMVNAREMIIQKAKEVFINKDLLDEMYEGFEPLLKERLKKSPTETKLHLLRWTVLTRVAFEGKAPLDSLTIGQRQAAQFCERRITAGCSREDLLAKLDRVEEIIKSSISHTD